VFAYQVNIYMCVLVLFCFSILPILFKIKIKQRDDNEDEGGYMSMRQPPSSSFFFSVVSIRGALSDFSTSQVYCIELLKEHQASNYEL
jgi:hypothetical protein